MSQINTSLIRNQIWNCAFTLIHKGPQLHMPRERNRKPTSYTYAWTSVDASKSTSMAENRVELSGKHDDVNSRNHSDDDNTMMLGAFVYIKLKW